MKHAFEVKRLVCLLVCIGFILGMDTSSLSLFLGAEYFKRYFKFPNALHTGMMTAANQIGGFLGCLLSGVIIESIGCRWSLCLCGIVWTTGSIGSIFVAEVYTMALGRLVKGLSVGILSVLASFYLMEVFSSNIRGQATALLQMALTMSILAIYFLSLSLDRIQNSLAFKITWGVETLPSVLLLVLFKALPESPRWLSKHNCTEEQIKKSLNIIKVTDIEKFKEKVSVDSNQVPSISFIIRKGYWKHVLLGISVQVLIQLSGINVIMYYMVYICEMVGFDEEISSKLTAGPYIVNVLFTLIPVFLLDKFNRKVFIGWASFLLGTIMLTVGVLIGERERHLGDVIIRNIVISLCFLFVSVFASSLSCAGFVYTNEILPESIKSVALSVCISTSWLSGFVLALMTPKLMQLVEWWTFIILGISTITMSFIIIIWFPETKGLSPDEINDLFDDIKTDIDLPSEKMEEIQDIESMPNRSGAPEPDSLNNHSVDLEILHEI